MDYEMKHVQPREDAGQRLCGKRQMIKSALVGWWRGMVVRTLILAGKLSLSHTRPSSTYVGKPSAGGQPTRSTQPFIPSESINE